MKNNTRTISHIRRQTITKKKREVSEDIVKPQRNKSQKNYQIKVWSYDYDMVD